MIRGEAMRWGLGLRWGLVLLGVALAAAVQTAVAYRTGALAAFAAPVVVAGLALVLLRPMFGVYLAVLAIPLELFEAELGATAISATEALLLLTAMATVAGSVVKRFRLRASLHPAHAAMAGLLVVSLLGVFVAVEAAAVIEVVVLWTTFLIISILVASASREQLERVLVCLVIAGGIVGVVALLRASTPELYQGGQEVANRAEGTFGHPNQLAFFLVLTIPIGIALIGRARTSLKVLGAAAAGVEIPALLMTFSRAGIIGLAVTLMVLALWPAFRRAAVVALAAVIVFAAFNADAISRNKEVSQISQRLETVTTAAGRGANPRLPIYDTALQMIANRPWLGVGHRNFSEVSPLYGLYGNYGEGYVHAHNVFLAITTETGLAGLAFFVAFVGMLARAAWVALQRRPDAYALVLAMAAGLTGLLTMGITDYPLGINVVMATIMILAGAIVAYARSSPLASAPRLASGRGGTAAAASLS